MRFFKATASKRAALLWVLSAALSTGIPAGETPKAGESVKKEMAAPAAKEPASFAKAYRAWQAKKVDEAIAGFEQAIKEEPKHAASLQFLARGYYERKRHADSVKLGKQAAALDPKNARIWRTLGLAQMASNDLKGAAESFDKAVKIEPKEFWSQNNLGYALLQLGKNDQSCKALEAAVKINAKNAMTWNTLGVARLRTNDRAGAAEAFRRALALQPDHAKAKANLAAADAPPVAKK